VAYIIDGNGRWAERRGLRRPEGHNAGANTTVDIVKATFDAGVQYITLYVFSTENWVRPTPEVGNIMDLLNAYLKDVSPYLVKHKIHLKVIGEKHRLSAVTQQLLDATGYKGGSSSRDPVPEAGGAERVGGAPNPAEGERVLCLAISYGGRQDVVQSAQKLADRVRRAELRVEDIDEATFAQGTYLGMLGIPDPDLILRTSGEFRLSNFLLWQSAYAELATVECLCEWRVMGRGGRGGGCTPHTAPYQPHPDFFHLHSSYSPFSPLSLLHHFIYTPLDLYRNTATTPRHHHIPLYI
jgi:undecaprenyl diphosphate synthase